MNSEIRTRKRKFTAFVTAIMLIMCSVVPAFAATYTADDLSSWDTTKVNFVNPGDKLQIDGYYQELGGNYEYAIVYYDKDMNEAKKVSSRISNKQRDNGGYYFEHTTFDYTDVFDDEEGAILFKEWEVMHAASSAGTGGEIDLMPVFYDRGDIVYHIPDTASNSPLNPACYPVGEGTEIADAIADTGYVFEGWYGSADYNNRVESIPASQIGIVHLYAKVQAASYEINYELDGGINDASNPSSYTYGVGVDAFGPAIKEGYTFEGWYDSADYSNRVESISASQTGAVNLYAKMQAASYEINYELDGGTNDASNPSSYTYGVGVNEFKAAVKDGYTFEGWYSDAEFASAASSVSDTQSGNITLYAKFTKNNEDPVNPPDDGNDNEDPVNPPDDGNDNEDPVNPPDDGKDEPAVEPVNPGDTDPKLGDDGRTLFIVVLAGLTGLATVTTVVKKYRNSEEN